MTQHTLRNGYSIAVGDIINHTRNDIRHQILYYDNEVVLMRSEYTTHDNTGNTTRLDSRAYFDASIEADYYVPLPNSDLELVDNPTVIDWTEVNYVGEQTNESLHGNGFKTMLDVRHSDTDELQSVRGVGTQAARNLVEFARTH